VWYCQLGKVAEQCARIASCKQTPLLPIIKASVSPQKSSATRSGCISASRSAFGPVEELLAQRGIVVTYETVRQWCLKFGQTYANELRRHRPHCGDKWHMDEVFLTIGGKKHSLWRAVDQDGNVLDILVQSRRNTQAAKRFFRKLLKGLQSVPRVIITDKLASYGQQNERSCRALSIGSTNDSTTEQRTPITPHDCVSGKCDVLSRLGMRNGFFLPVVPSPAISNHAGIVSVPGNSAAFYSVDFRCGMR